jgi:hypothetical protein
LQTTIAVHRPPPEYRAAAFSLRTFNGAGARGCLPPVKPARFHGGFFAQDNELQQVDSAA